MPRRCWDKLELKTWVRSSMKAIDDVGAALYDNVGEINHKDSCVGESNNKQLEMVTLGDCGRDQPQGLLR